jgi:hypothetical protein
MSRPPGFCRGCGINRVAWTEPRVDYCYTCLPGGPFPAPVCRVCGSVDYFSQGMCQHCHPGSPEYLDSCQDCCAFGVLRQHNWRCWGCRQWHARYPIGDCPHCRRRVPIGDAGACRLCWQQAVRMKEPGRPLDLAGANRYGQQLFFANMQQSPKGSRQHQTRSRKAASTSVRVQARAGVGTNGFTPITYRQFPLFHIRANLLALRLTAAPRRDMALFCDQVLLEHAAARGWSVKHRNDVGHTLRLLQVTQATPGARISASEVQRLGRCVQSTLEILEAAGLLDDDRVAPERRYFDNHTRGLPPAMINQLEHWFQIMSTGSQKPPRQRPRNPTTIRIHLQDLEPVLRAWADQVHQSLNEITRQDVVAILPVDGSRVSVGTALRSLFGLLKAHKRVFVNPTIGAHIGQVGQTMPMPMDIDRIRQALDSPDPAAAAAVALVVFHALTSMQIRNLLLTDLRDGRLRLGERDIPLAEPVRQRVAAYLDHRGRRWPESLNPHLFINRRNAPRLNRVGPNFPWLAAGIRPQALREDRILAEIHATGGDIRRLCDLFGLSVAGATRYGTTIEHPDLAGTPHSGS